MKDKIRVVMVDPSAASRQMLQGQLGKFPTVDLVETCLAYQGTLRRVATLLPDVVILVADDDLEQALLLVESLARSQPTLPLILAGSICDSDVILRSVRAGAREFLPLPVSPIEMLDAIQRLAPRPESGATNGAPAGPQMVAVTGAAGGVGCTSIAVNLATTLAKLSRFDAVIADFDLLLGSLEESLGVIPDNSLEMLVRNLEDMDASILKRWLPRHPCGLYILPHPVNMEEAARLDPAALQAVLTLLRASFHSVVVDTSKGLQATDFLAFEAADVILVVIQLNLNCTRNTVRLLQYLRQFEGMGDKLRLVVNRVNSPLSEISLKKAEELLKMPISWQVPNSTKLFRPARTLGIPVDEVDEGTGSRVQAAFLEMAQSLQPFPVEASKAKRKLFHSFL